MGQFVLERVFQNPQDSELSDQQERPEHQTRPGHLLVRFNANASPAEVASLKANRVVGENAALRITHLKVSPEEELAVFDQLKRSSAVEFVEFDSIVTTQFVPNDTYYATPYASSHYGNIAQWGPPAVSAPAAWDITQGDSSTVIAIVDTGVDDTHPDLAAKIVGEYSFTGKVKDGFGHGTHCAGIAAAVTNDSLGVAGMCPNCKILSVKVLDDNGSGFISDVANGITYAADHGAQVISLSLGGSGRSQTLRAALDYAVNHNALPVCAMGNSNTASATPEPAYWFNCLSVIATDDTGARAYFSNYGDKADVAAPGVGILSTMPTYSTYLSSHGYMLNYDALSGTSMATPMVAGLAGLVRSRNPNLTATQVKGIIMATAGDGKSWSPELGFGVVNAARAVQAALNTDYAPPTVNLISPAPGVTISELVTIQAVPTDNVGVHHVDFVIEGTRAGVPGTAAVGGGKRTTTAWATQWESTRYWNGPQTVTAVAFDMAGNSASQDVPFAILNTYKTATWTAHLCNPPTAACPYYILNPVTPQYAATAHVQVNWTYTRLDNYSNATFWATSFNGWQQDLFFTQGLSIDFFPSNPLCGCDKNQVGAGMAGWVKKNGGAEANVTVTLTYPE